MMKNISKFYFLVKCKKKCNQRRGVSEIISILLMVVVTVIGGITVLGFIQNENSFQIPETIISENQKKSVRVIGYDTRDSTSLVGIVGLDNYFDQKLCTISCQYNVNKIPQNLGTEFIVLKLRNDGVAPVWLDNIIINDVSHKWDSTTAGNILDATIDYSNGNIPRDGMFSTFSVFESSPVTQRSEIEINPGLDRYVLVKLSNKISDDILLFSPIHIVVDLDNSDYHKSYVISGGAR